MRTVPVMAAAIADIPERERPRERLLRCGLEALSERELLALVLRNGRGGEGALDLATSLLGEHGTLAALASARIEELAQRPGIGVAKAAAIVAAFRLGRLAGERPVSPVLRGAADVVRNASSELAALRRERVVVLVCDGGNCVRRTVVLTEGSIDRSLLPIRDVLNAVLRHDGRAFAVAHNHPSGDSTPSEDDRRATAELSEAAAIVGLRFLDHVIVAGSEWRSVATPSWRMPR
jgi:DNA repair protein RadC